MKTFNTATPETPRAIMFPEFVCSGSDRSLAAFKSINQSMEGLAAAGFVVSSRGEHAGHAGTYPVFVYRAEDVSKLRLINNPRVAVFSGRVEYKHGQWFISESAHAESLASCLAEAFDELITQADLAQLDQAAA